MVCLAHTGLSEVFSLETNNTVTGDRRPLSEYLETCPDREYTEYVIATMGKGFGECDACQKDALESIRSRTPKLPEGHCKCEGVCVFFVNYIHSENPCPRNSGKKWGHKCEHDTRRQQLYQNQDRLARLIREIKSNSTGMKYLSDDEIVYRSLVMTAAIHKAAMGRKKSPGVFDE